MKAICIVFAALFTIGAAGWEKVAATTAPPDAPPPCEEEVVYGTVVLLDGTTGHFTLGGTDYEFIVDDPFVAVELDGMQVRLELAADCSVRDLRVIGDSDALT